MSTPVEIFNGSGDLLLASAARSRQLLHEGRWSRPLVDRAPAHSDGLGGAQKSVGKNKAQNARLKLRCPNAMTTTLTLFHDCSQRGITGKRWADDTPTSAVEHRLRYDPGRWKAESRWHCLATEDWRLLTSKPSAVAVQAAALTRAITKFGRSQRAEERKQCSTDLRVDARLMAALESVSGLLIVQ